MSALRDWLREVLLRCPPQVSVASGVGAVGVVLAQPNDEHVLHEHCSHGLIVTRAPQGLRRVASPRRCVPLLAHLRQRARPVEVLLDISVTTVRFTQLSRTKKY